MILQPNAIPATTKPLPVWDEPRAFSPRTRIAGSLAIRPTSRGHSKQHLYTSRHGASQLGPL
ncbi:MAG: hypothetical protein ACRDHP_14660, partial [Ktedonobacterales bacterium]